MSIILFWLFFAIMGFLSMYSGLYWLAMGSFTMFGGITGALYVFWEASKIISLPDVLQKELEALEEEIKRQQTK